MKELEIGIEYYLDKTESSTGVFVKKGVDKGRDVIWFKQGKGNCYEKSPNGLIGFLFTGREYKKAVKE